NSGRSGLGWPGQSSVRVAQPYEVGVQARLGPRAKVPADLSSLRDPDRRLSGPPGAGASSPNEPNTRFDCKGNQPSGRRAGLGFPERTQRPRRRTNPTAPWRRWAEATGEASRNAGSPNEPSPRRADESMTPRRIQVGGGFSGGPDSLAWVSP